MNKVSYSVVIRTLGNTGDKYKALLDSIDSQILKPEEVIVVIPNGYELDYRLGYERVVHSEKGMVMQRAIGIREAKSDYVLVLDDDLQFDEHFVFQLYESLNKNDLDCVLSFPKISEDEVQLNNKTLDFKTKMKSYFDGFRRVLTGQHIVTYCKEEKWFDVVTPSAGHKTYESNPLGLCTCGCFQCFFAKTVVAQEVRFEDEMWLEQGTISRYAAYDDMVFFYKMYLNGGRIAYSDKARYVHLDAGAGRPAKSKLEAKRIRLYTISRNRTIFWKKYLLKPAPTFTRKTRVFLGGYCAFFNYAIYNMVVNVNPKNWKAIVAMFKGYKEAARYRSV